MKMKYLIINTVNRQNISTDLPFIFPVIFDHKSFSKTCLSALNMKPYMKREIIAAGYVDLKNVICYGHSLSLNIYSRGEKDIAVIQKLLNP